VETSWHSLERMVDRDYEIDIQHYGDLFAAVDRSSPASLRAWFEGHPYLTRNDVARIGSVSLRTVGRWWTRAGHPTAARQGPCYRRPPPLPLVAPADWRASRWLVEQYLSHSIRAIARAVGRSYTSTRRRLQRLGVQFPTKRDAVRSRHPCCTLRWLFGHYVVQGLSITRCARLAFVSKSTITNWLITFRLRIRTNSEQQMANYWLTPGVPFDLGRTPRLRKRRKSGGN